MADPSVKLIPDDPVLLGGILDGVRIRTGRARPAFIWIDSRRGHIAYRMPGKCRLLYRRVGAHHYLYAGNTHALCGGCGAYVERVDGHVRDCALCGAALLRA